MKKVLLSLAALTVAGTVLAQVPTVKVSPKAIRTYGDQTDVGAVTVFGTTAGTPVPACGANPAVRGTGLIGHNANRHSCVTVLIFDKDELNAARAAQIAAGGTGAMNLLLENALNSNTLGHSVMASLTDMSFARVVMEGLGPFNIRPAAGNDWANLIWDGVESQPIAYAPVIPWALRTDPVTLATTTTQVGNYRLPLSGGGGGGSLNVCLGPTGQARFLDDGNNGDWATDCVANGWRPTTVVTGGGSSAWDDALASPSPGALSTFQVTCGAALQGVGVNSQIATSIANPVGITLAQVDGANLDHRAYHFFTAGAIGMQVFSQNPAAGFAKIFVEVN